MSDWVIRLIEQSGYLGVGFLMFLETIFPPIPSEVIMPVAGMAAAKGKLGFVPVVASGTAGAMLGNLVWYLAARALGIHRLKPLIDRYGRWLTLTWPEIVRAERWFAHHGTAFVFFGRLLPTVRSLVSVPAGLLRMRFRNFFIASLLGTAAWTTVLATAGYKLQENVEDVGTMIGPISNAILVTLAIAYAYRLWTHRNVGQSD
ncbi:MAG TPA: DedA family protein [Sphingomicrobium sp.]|jgi:membrane protein DedA with SNARE-associated domain